MLQSRELVSARKDILPSLRCWQDRVFWAKEQWYINGYLSAVFVEIKVWEDKIEARGRRRGVMGLRSKANKG